MLVFMKIHLPTGQNPVVRKIVEVPAATVHLLIKLVSLVMFMKYVLYEIKFVCTLKNIRVNLPNNGHSHFLHSLNRLLKIVEICNLPYEIYSHLVEFLTTE